MRLRLLGSEFDRPAQFNFGFIQLAFGFQSLRQIGVSNRPDWAAAS